MNKDILPVTVCKSYSPAAGATQGYDRLHTNRYRHLQEIGEIVLRMKICLYLKCVLRKIFVVKNANFL